MSRTALIARRLRPTVRRASLAGGVVVACVASTVVGVPVASAAPAGPSRVPPSAAHPSAKPPPVDHHLCYIARGKYQIPADVELFNQFSPKGFTPKIGAVAFHCNPVVKILASSKRFPITHPAAHLVM